MSLFDPVDLKVDFIKQEHEVLKFWEKEKIFQKLIEKNKGGPRWSFIDGPMTANNPMGVHHAWGRTYKDVFQRYKAMRGFEQRFQNGFDCQGLWLEVETERDLGFNSKRDIENFGLDRFSRACRARVDKFSNVQTQQSIRLGQWMDWENSYYTMTDTNIEYIWHFLGVCHDKGWLRQGHQVMPWCTRCGTSLSQHELADAYEDIEDTSVFLGFKLKPGVRRDGPWSEGASGGVLPGEGERLLVWTTTPWTLTSNVAAAVNPDLAYVKVRSEGIVYYVSAGVARAIFGEKAEILGEVKGSEMVGWTYEGPFDDLPVQEGVEHVVIPWEEVGETEGSGIVHIAPGCGAEDFDLGTSLGLPAIAPLDEFGIYGEGFGWLTGMDVHKVEEPIIKDLERKGILVGTEKYQHRYPFCWRCHEKLVFRLVDEWFIKCDEIRPLMKKAAETVRWIPESIGKRTQDWYDNMGDWCISRKRYWGLPLPFYFCPDGHLTIVRSKAHLREFAVDPSLVDDLPELHRPWIDAVKIRCQHDGCGKEATRIPDVGDCWLDAGIVAFSTLKYLEDREYWEKWFPADLVCEMREQVRLWFYAMMFTSVTLEGRAPYKAVFSYEKVYDERGEPMHKSKGNAIWFDEAVERMGADVMRWLYCAVNPNQNLRFGYGVADEMRRKIITLWNVYSFLVTYAELDGFDPAKEADPSAVGGSPNALDRWIISSLYRLVGDCRRFLDDYDVMSVLREADRFLENLSTWYVRRSRRRFWKSESDEDKKWAHRTLYHVLLTYVRLLAPVIPFVTEVIYRNLTKRARELGEESVLRLGVNGGPTPESVHLTPYPEERPELVDESLNEAMDFVLRAVSLGRAAREKARIKVRQPLAKMWIIPLQGARALEKLDPHLKDDLLSQIGEELNVKAIDLPVGDPDEFSKRGIRLNFAVLGKRLGPAMKEVQRKVEAGEYELATDGALLVAGEKIGPEEYEIVYEAKDGVSLAHDRYTMVVFDVKITEELRLEGWAREIVRRVQDLRKKAGYNVEDRITVFHEAADSGDSDLPSASLVFERHGDYVAQETLAVQLVEGKGGGDVDASATVALAEGRSVWVGVKRA